MKTQINLTIPLAWKERLEEIAFEASTPNRSQTYSDMIREAIRSHYEIPGLDEEEVFRCARDFNYFIENHVLIHHPLKGVIPFRMYDYQRAWAQHLRENRYSIATKFRQGGFTTTTAMFLYWKAAFGLDSVKIMVVAKTDKEVVALGDIIREAHKLLPDTVRPTLIKNNDHQMFFENGSRIYFSTPEPACRTTVDWLFIDEAAFIPNMLTHWKALYPTLSKGGRCIVLSTVNGLGNWFADVYRRSSSEVNDFKKFFAHYSEHPDYADPEWARNTQAQLGEHGWRQEVLQQFVVDKPKRLNFNVDAEALTDEKFEKLKTLLQGLDLQWS